jgi:hypothetical protein
MTREPANFGIQPTALHAAADAGAFGVRLALTVMEGGSGPQRRKRVKK